MSRFSRIPRKCMALLVSAALAASSISCGPPALGLQDYQRDILFTVLGALADALLFQVATGDMDGAALDAPAPAGARGPDAFSVQIENFFGAQFDDNFVATPMQLDTAVLAEGSGPIGFRAPIPLTYGINGERRPVNLRLVFLRSGPCDGSCTSFTIDTRCLESGTNAPVCFGGASDDCSDGRRWVQLPQVCTSGESTTYIVADLPLGSSGLMLPDVGPGDFLAFELNAVVTDGGSYRLVGAELYDAVDVAPNNAMIFATADAVPEACRQMDSNDFDGDMIPDTRTDGGGDTNNPGNDREAPNGGDADDDDDGIPDDDEGDMNDDGDGDGDPDSLDIDRDNDGIVDLVEAQPSGAGFIPPSGTDADDDGIDDAYDADQGGTPLTPPDTDGDGILDVDDLDADGDLVPDRTEGHDANMDGQPDVVFSGGDADTDGLDDVYDTVMRPLGGNSVGSNAPLQDTDGDGTPDWRDPDDDGDGIPTRDEDVNGDGDPTNDDTDGDGTPNYLDPDGDFDGDDVPDDIDEDDDGDGIPDDEEGPGDPDGDGNPNFRDIDRDNDGIVDNVESQPRGAGYVPPSGIDADMDGLDDAYDADQGGTPIVLVNSDDDGTPDIDDLDSDNDNVPDSIEGHDANMDGVPDVTPSGNDADTDGLDDVYDTIVRPAPGNSTGSNAPLQDTDSDGTPDWRDPDDDGDDIPSKEEDANNDGDPTNDDTDGDGTPDYLDPEDFDGDGVPDNTDKDDDDDGIPDDEEGPGDNDGDGNPNAKDIDRDNDGIVDNVESQPRGAGYIPPSGIDADMDGLDDAYDPDQGGTPIVLVNSDDDGTPDIDDLDSDNDTVPDSIEGHDANMDGVPDVTPSGNDADMDGLDDVYDTIVRPAAGNSVGSNAPLQDTDGDGTPDWRDPDDDGDGIPTKEEDANGDGDPTNDDTDGDGTPDYLDPDNDCNDNDVPDHRDLEDGTSEDCNGNDRPDECDIADGTSEDTNKNGIPDECEMMGACCFDDDTCIEATEIACTKFNGEFLGPHTECVSVGGLLATYYDDRDFQGDTVTRIDEAIDFNWGSGSPAPGISSNTFSVVWEGYVRVPMSGPYTFYATNDDGMRVYVDEQLVVDRWVNQAARTTTGEIELAAGMREIRVEYYEHSGAAVARLEWSSSDIGRETIPSDVLSHGVAYCPDSVGACCLPDGSCAQLPAPLCDEAMGTFLGVDTPCEKAPSDRTTAGTHLLRNGASFPQGGMVLNDVLGEDGAVWFDFDAPGAAMYMTYDDQANTVRVAGFAAATIGGTMGFAYIDVLFNDAVAEAGELQVPGESGSNTGTVVWLPTGEVVTVVDKQSDGVTFRLYDLQGANKGEAWFNNGMDEFHFEATLQPYCAPEPTGACCLPDDTCVGATEAVCLDLQGAYQGDDSTCELPPTTRTDDGSYRLRNGASYPKGGLVLRDVFGGDGNVWFDFDAEGASMFMTYDSTAATVHVTGYAAASINGVNGFAYINMLYRDVIEQNGELRVTTPNGTNVGTVLWIPTGEIVEMRDKQGSGRTFRFYRYSGSYDKGLGWFYTDHGTGDFHFEGSRAPFCEPGEVGACCIGDDCAVLPQVLCETLHGTYAGDGTTCDEACAPTCPGDIIEDFEDGDGGWDCENADNCGIEDGMGNPGDTFGGCDANGETRVVAGPKFLGDLRTYDGGSFGLDILFFKAEPLEGRAGIVMIETSEGTFTQDIIPSITPQSRVWNTYSGAFTAAAFGTDQATWEAGLENVTRVRIVIEPGWDCWCIDNVKLTCPPAP